MAKLLLDSKRTDIKMITETKVVSGSQKIYIKGIFQQFGIENQNGRIYPREVMLPEINRYINEYVKTGRAFGELDHPEGPEINGDRICHRIVDLWVEGNDVWGKSLLLNTTMGKEVQAMTEDGGVMGVSSRALGEMDHRNMVNDMHLICWDVVQEPSVATALMESLNESKNYDLKKYIEKEKIILSRLKNINKIDEKKLISEFRSLLKNLV